MKRTVSKVFTILACMVLFLSVSGCSNLEVTKYYKYFGLEDMYYIVSEHSTALNFFNALGAIMTSYDGTDFKEKNLIKDIDKVVKQYDNGVLSGTFYLKKSDVSEDGPWENVTSWTMSFSSIYDKAGESVSTTDDLSSI